MPFSDGVIRILHDINWSEFLLVNAVTSSGKYPSSSDLFNKQEFYWLQVFFISCLPSFCFQDSISQIHFIFTIFSSVNLTTLNKAQTAELLFYNSCIHNVMNSSYDQQSLLIIYNTNIYLLTSQFGIWNMNKIVLITEILDKWLLCSVAITVLVSWNSLELILLMVDFLREEFRHFFSEPEPNDLESEPKKFSVSIFC